MAQNSLIEQLMTDLAELPDEGALSFEKSVSYELATRLVHFRIRELGLAHAGARFQFRIRAAVPGSAEFGGTDEDDALTSS